MSTLLAGDTRWWTDELITRALGPSERVVVLDDTVPATENHASIGGKRDLDRSRIRHVLVRDCGDLEKLCALGFTNVVYLSYELAFDGSGGHRHSTESQKPERYDALAPHNGTAKAAPTRDAEKLDLLLSLLAHRGGTRVVFVGTDAVNRSFADAATPRQRALEDMCRHYRELGLDVVMLRAPRLLERGCERDFWVHTCNGLASGEGLASGNGWELPVSAAEPLDFVSARDLATLLHDVLEDWPSTGVLRLHASGSHIFADATRVVCAALDAPTPACAAVVASEYRDANDEADVGSLYGFTCADDTLQTIAAIASDARTAHPQPNKRHPSRLKEALRLGSPLVTVLELALGLALLEWVESLFGSSVQFRMIDLRLIYVVIFAATYGANAGVAAALVMGASLAAAYLRQGYTLTMLFYDAQNWVPFVLYFVVGYALGYIRQKGDEDLSALEGRVARTSNDLAFVEGLYDEACTSRDAYRRDLLASRDGFGRIFDVVQKLSLEEPSRIFAASVGVLEDVLDTKSVAIYIVNDSAAGFARLVVSSKGLRERLPKSMRIQDLAPAKSALDAGEVWFNASLDPGLPSYVAGIRSEGELVVLVMVFDATYDQASSYYMNLIRILTGLMENFLVRAWHDEQARTAARHVPGTGLLTTDELKAELASLQEMRERQVGDYRMLEVVAEGKPLPDVWKALSHQLRSTDYAGVGNNGQVYVLLRQVDDSTLQIVEKRFHDAGLDTRRVQAEELS